MLLLYVSDTDTPWHLYSWRPDKDAGHKMQTIAHFTQREDAFFYLQKLEDLHRQDEATT